MCMPVSKGGRDIWENVVAACFHCNSRKGNRTPQQAGMPLLAVPYRPSWVEHLILSATATSSPTRWRSCAASCRKRMPQAKHLAGVTGFIGVGHDALAGAPPTMA